MTEHLSILDIPQDVLDSAGLTLDQLRIELAVHLYEERRLSIGKAHELAGLSLWEFRQILGARGIAPHFDSEDLEQDLETLKEHHRRQWETEKHVMEAPPPAPKLPKECTAKDPLAEESAQAYIGETLSRITSDLIHLVAFLVARR